MIARSRVGAALTVASLFASPPAARAQPQALRARRLPRPPHLTHRSRHHRPRRRPYPSRGASTSTARAPSIRSPRPSPRSSRRRTPASRSRSAFSGTGGGFKKFCTGEIDINDASRPIKADSRRGEALQGEGHRVHRAAGRHDGLSVVVNEEQLGDLPDDGRAQEDLGPEAQHGHEVGPSIRRWPGRADQAVRPGRGLGDIRLLHRGHQRQGQAEPLRLHAVARTTTSWSRASPATRTRSATSASPTRGEPRQDQGRSPIDSGKGCIEPSADTVNAGTYTPLARPLFIYPSISALKRPEFAAFVQYYLDNVNTYVDETGYIEAHPDVLAKSKSDLAAALK